MPNAYASGAVMLEVGILDQVQLLHATRYAKFRRVIKETDISRRKSQRRGEAERVMCAKPCSSLIPPVMQKQEVSDVALTTSL